MAPTNVAPTKKLANDHASILTLVACALAASAAACSAASAGTGGTSGTLSGCGGDGDGDAGCSATAATTGATTTGAAGTFFAGTFTAETLAAVGGATSTMLSQRGQARIWPISDSLRTVSFAWHVTQIILKGSTDSSLKEDLKEKMTNVQIPMTNDYRKCFVVHFGYILVIGACSLVVRILIVAT